MLDSDHDRILKALAATLSATGTGGTVRQQVLVLRNADELVYRSVREGMAGLNVSFMWPPMGCHLAHSAAGVSQMIFVIS